jgi:hypothetical protein
MRLSRRHGKSQEKRKLKKGHTSSFPLATPIRPWCISYVPLLVSLACTANPLWRSISIRLQKSYGENAITDGVGGREYPEEKRVFGSNRQHCVLYCFWFTSRIQATIPDPRRLWQLSYVNVCNSIHCLFRGSGVLVPSLCWVEFSLTVERTQAFGRLWSGLRFRHNGRCCRRRSGASLISPLISWH